MCTGRSEIDMSKQFDRTMICKIQHFLLFFVFRVSKILPTTFIGTSQGKICVCVLKTCSYLVKISTQPPRLQNHSSHRPTNHPSSEVSGWENQQKNRETQRGINITELLWLKLLVTASRNENEIETIQTKKIILLLLYVASFKGELTGL